MIRRLLLRPAALLAALALAAGLATAAASPAAALTVTPESVSCSGWGTLVTADGYPNFWRVCEWFGTDNYRRAVVKASMRYSKGLDPVSGEVCAEIAMNQNGVRIATSWDIDAPPSCHWVEGYTGEWYSTAWRLNPVGVQAFDAAAMPDQVGGFWVRVRVWS
jgi:hypothetical protein